MTAPLVLAAIARARAIVVPSRWTALELQRIGVSARRMVVVPHAPTLDPAGAEDSALQRLDLAPGGYILFVGTLEPRKNVATLVAAFELLAAEHPGMKLVLAGASGWLFAGTERRIAASPVRDRILRTGYVPGKEVAGLIRGCAAFAYVSLYEGFGMPVLDALAFGVPVVTSRTTAMPEAAGGAAILADPRRPADIARGLAEAMARRDELRTRGVARAAARSWQDVAREHRAVYRFAADRPVGG